MISKKTIAANIKENLVFFKILAINVLVTFATIIIFQTNERLEIKSIPDPVYIKNNKSKQIINCTFYLENKRTLKLSIYKVAIRVFDRFDKVILEDQLRYDPIRTGKNRINNFELVQGLPIFFNNPFSVFNTELELHKIEYRFTYINSFQTKFFEQMIEIYPRYPESTAIQKNEISSHSEEYLQNKTKINKNLK